MEGKFEICQVNCMLLAPRADFMQIISPACEIQPLCEFAVVEGLQRSSEQGSEPALMKIGVDGRFITVPR